MAAEPRPSGGVVPEPVIAWHPVPWPHGPAQQSAAGRHAAAAALSSAGSAERTVPRDPHGRPCFPRGFPGSISHTAHLAVAVVVPGAEAVGADIESAAVTARMAAFVLGERERRTLLPPAGEYSPRELFAAKEAAYKAMNGAGTTGEFLFWRIGLSRSGGTLTASYRGVRVPLWIHSEAGHAFAVAIRR